MIGASLVTMAIASLGLGGTAVLAQSSDFGQSSGNITINPIPKFETCKPVNITWSGGYVPGDYVLYFYPDGSAGDELLLFVNNIQEQWYEWPVFLEAGTKFIINVFDQGNDQYAGPFTIEDSGDTSCVFPMEEHRSSLSARVNGGDPTGSGSGGAAFSGAATAGTPSTTTPPQAFSGPSVPQSSTVSPSSSGTSLPNAGSRQGIIGSSVVMAITAVICMVCLSLAS